jgi:Rrf2 family protein
MNLFENGRRAIRILLALALKHDAKVALHVKTIAMQAGGDVKAIQDICETLVKEGYLLRDVNAAKSYRLALEPDQIKLGNIIRICEPDFHITDCKRAKTCPVKDSCYFDRKFWGEFEIQMFNMLNSVTLQAYYDNMIEMSYVAPEKCPLSQLKE